MVTASSPCAAKSRSAASISRSRNSPTALLVNTRGKPHLSAPNWGLPVSIAYVINLQRKTLRLPPQRQPEDFPMDGSQVTSPYLTGNFAPVRSEDDFELEVTGEIPQGMAGAFY